MLVATFWRLVRHWLARCAVAAMLLLPASLLADTHRITPDRITQALQAQGYRVQSVTETILGRAQIVAQNGLIWREVVLDIASGEILRDYAVEFTPNELPPRHSQVMPRGGRLLAPGALPLSEN